MEHSPETGIAYFKSGLKQGPRVDYEFLIPAQCLDGTKRVKRYGSVGGFVAFLRALALPFAAGRQRPAALSEDLVLW